MIGCHNNNNNNSVGLQQVTPVSGCWAWLGWNVWRNQPVGMQFVTGNRGFVASLLLTYRAKYWPLTSVEQVSAGPLALVFVWTCWLVWCMVSAVIAPPTLDSVRGAFLIWTHYDGTSIWLVQYLCGPALEILCNPTRIPTTPGMMYFDISALWIKKKSEYDFFHFILGRGKEIYVSLWFSRFV